MTKHRKYTKETTPKQQRVISCFDGDYISTAKNAGVTHTYVRRLCTNVKYKHIQEAIRHRNSKKSTKLGKIIASREERQAFWTKVLTGAITEPVVTGIDSEGNKIVINIPPKMADRLKASELLGRSEADFTDNQRISDPDGKALSWKVEIVDPQPKKIINKPQQITDGSES